MPSLGKTTRTALTEVTSLLSLDFHITGRSQHITGLHQAVSAAVVRREQLAARQPDRVAGDAANPDAPPRSTRGIQSQHFVAPSVAFERRAREQLAQLRIGVAEPDAGVVR